MDLLLKLAELSVSWQGFIWQRELGESQQPWIYQQRSCVVPVAKKLPSGCAHNLVQGRTAWKASLQSAQSEGER